MKEPTLATIGQRLRAERTRQQLSQAKLAQMSGVSQGLIAQIEGGINEGSKHAVSIASALGVSTEWLVSGNEPAPSTNMASDNVFEYAGAAARPAVLPVAGIAQLGENGWYDEIDADGSEGYVEHHTSDADAYALRVKGDSMHPAIRNGWYVIVEPSMSLAGGLYAAVALRDGRKLVKEYLYETPSEYALQSVNGGTRLTIDRDDILTIHGVAAVVAPSKHKD